MARATASLSLDMDNAWAYLRTHCDPRWTTYPSYLHTFVPLVLDFLAQHDMTITFMVVGRDVACEENHNLLQQIAAAGHEIGNHSFNHEAWMQDYDEEQVADEIVRTETTIAEVTGTKPVGFRGPGYACSETILDVLHRLGYQYDSSLLPSILNPIARLYYMWGTAMSQTEKRERGELFGHFRDGFARLAPFYWNTPTGDLLEFPITTVPCLRTPFHLSYLLWLSRYSARLAMKYLRIGLFLCRLRGIEPSYLLHPLDFLGAEDAPELSFFPGMQFPRQYKLAFARQFLEEFRKHFNVVPIRQHLRKVRECSSLKHVLSARLRNGSLHV